MVLTVKESMPLLEDVFNEIDFVPDIVFYIGGTPEEIGAFFGKRFDCSTFNLPSTGIKGSNGNKNEIAHFIYNNFHESIRFPLSRIYMAMRKRREVVYPNFKFNGELDNVERALLVDDNVNTGYTMEYWKGRLHKEGIGVKTFAITSISDYKPDYFCIKGWRSFEWRPIGV